MMLGMAASISMARPTGLASHGGAISVRKTATPRPTGVAMAMAMAEETTVP